MDPSIIAAGISGIASLLGGKKKGVDLQRLRRDAEAAGFNPLTALMATGGQGYQRDAGPMLSGAAYLADAISRGADTFFNTPGKVDARTDFIRKAQAYQDAARAAAASDPTRRFGFGLTDVAPFGSLQTLGGPKLPPMGVAGASAGSVSAAGGNAGSAGVAARTASGAEPLAVLVPMQSSSGDVFLGPSPDAPDSEQLFGALALNTWGNFQASIPEPRKRNYPPLSQTLWDRARAAAVGVDAAYYGGWKTAQAQKRRLLRVLAPETPGLASFDPWLEDYPQSYRDRMPWLYSPRGR